MPSRWPLGIVLLLLAVQLAASAWWIAEDDYPSGFEVCEHLLYTRKIADELRAALDRPDTARALGQWLAANRRIGGRSSGLHLALAVPLALWPGDGIALVSFLAGGLSLVVLAFACYALASRAAGPWSGAAATALVLLCPPIWGYARRYGADLPLAAATSLYALALVRWPPCDAGWRRPLALGLAGGLIALIKNAFVLWFVALIVSAVLLARRERRPIVRSLCWLAAGFAAGSAFFWWGAGEALAGYTQFHIAEGNPHATVNETFSLAGLAFYPSSAWRWLSPPLNVTLLAGAAMATLRRERTGLLWGWLLLGVLLFIAIGTKWARFLLPACPALCVLAAIGYARMPRPIALPALLAGLAGAAWLLVVATTGPPPAWSTIEGELCSPPVRSSWPDVARSVAHEVAPRRPRVIGIEGPARWDGDDYSRLELLLLEHFPLADVLRRSAARLPVELARYEAERERIELLIEVRAPHDDAPPRPGFVLLGRWPLYPAYQPLPGRPGGPPLQASAYLARRLLPDGKPR